MEQVWFSAALWLGLALVAKMLDPGIFRTKWKEAMGVGMVGFFGPFLAAAAVARFALGWSIPSSWLAGVALAMFARILIAHDGPDSTRKAFDAAVQLAASLGARLRMICVEE
jgi:hypothetical protein